MLRKKKYDQLLREKRLAEEKLDQELKEEMSKLESIPSFETKPADTRRSGGDGSLKNIFYKLKKINKTTS